MSRNKLIGIAAACVVIAVLVILATTVGPTPRAEAESPVSDFLRVGESYRAYTSGPLHDQYEFTVLEIINDKWILVEDWRSDEPYWLNTDQLVHIAED
jgi:hypothetical protein